MKKLLLPLVISSAVLGFSSVSAMTCPSISAVENYVKVNEDNLNEHISPPNVKINDLTWSVGIGGDTTVQPGTRLATNQIYFGISSDMPGPAWIGKATILTARLAKLSVPTI